MTTMQTHKGSELNVVQWQVTGHSQPLSTSYAHHMIDQIADIGTAKLVIRGDIPMQRKDLFSLIERVMRRQVVTADQGEHTLRWMCVVVHGRVHLQ